MQPTSSPVLISETKTYQPMVIDQVTFVQCVEYVVRFTNTDDPKDSFEKRFRADGTLADLQTQITDYLTTINVPLPVSEVPTGTIIDVGEAAVFTNPITKTPLAPNSLT